MQFKLMTFKNIIHQPPQRDDGQINRKRSNEGHFCNKLEVRRELSSK